MDSNFLVKRFMTLFSAVVNWWQRLQLEQVSRWLP